VRTAFHRSFAWFGTRTRFDGCKHYLDFLSKDICFTGQEVIILDTAPIVDGYTADIGFTFSKVPNPSLTKARGDLLEMRALLPQLFNEKAEASEIWSEIDQIFKKLGYDNCHKLYPFGVLGHRVHYAAPSKLASVLYPFTIQAYWSLLSRGVLGELLRADLKKVKSGFWAIEPHFGTRDLEHNFGIKFEEILVKEDFKATWLSDDVPHLKLPEGFF
jgi:hypothetical protein